MNAFELGAGAALGQLVPNGKVSRSRFPEKSTLKQPFYPFKWNSVMHSMFKFQLS